MSDQPSNPNEFFLIVAIIRQRTNIRFSKASKTSSVDLWIYGSVTNLDKVKNVLLLAKESKAWLRTTSSNQEVTIKKWPTWRYSDDDYENDFNSEDELEPADLNSTQASIQMEKRKWTYIALKNSLARIDSSGRTLELMLRIASESALYIYNGSRLFFRASCDELAYLDTSKISSLIEIENFEIIPQVRRFCLSSKYLYCLKTSPPEQLSDKKVSQIKESILIMNPKTLAVLKEVEFNLGSDEAVVDILASDRYVFSIERVYSSKANDNSHYLMVKQFTPGLMPRKPQLRFKINGSETIRKTSIMNLTKTSSLISIIITNEATIKVIFILSNSCQLKVIFAHQSIAVRENAFMRQVDIPMTYYTMDSKKIKKQVRFSFIKLKQLTNDTKCILSSVDFFFH